jgi:integrase/recombinase XerC
MYWYDCYRGCNTLIAVLTREHGPVNPPLAQQVEQFLQYLRDVRQLSPHTLTNYGRDLRNLQSFCNEHELATATDIQAGDIRAFASTLHRQGKQGKSIQRSLSAIRSFYNYLARQGTIRYNPANGIPAPRQVQRLPKTLDADQVETYLKIQGESPLDIRDQAMAELFYSSGLRLSELADLNLGDVDLAGQLVTVTGKGQKTRTLPVGRLALQAIRAWLAVRPEIEGEPAMFTSTRGARISVRNIQARLRKRGRETSMHQEVHPHMLRHSFASHMLESSGDLRAVQELLGHANISTTQIYTHLDFQHLAKVYDQAHPRAKRRDDEEVENDGE